ncbi:hypothetical protein FPV67DRAFT_1624405 [Lyophyllum atratum]|nr:hypothetical protein FPV67DRAFT_1624405 [Lyophyllum atratum]
MPGTGKASLSATNLAVHHHFNCDLYLYNAYHRPRIPGSYHETPELTRAQWQRGNDWEKSLFAWLARENLLLTVPSKPLDSTVLLENIQADDRDHFFIAGLTFLPPQEMLDARFHETGRDPLIFGLAKPDLLQIIRTRDGVKWKVIDAKVSSGIKTSHHAQIHFYTLCLAYILPLPFFRPEGSAGVWLPPADGFGKSPPSLDGLKSVNSSLLSTSLDRFLFEKIPDILSLPAENVKWHYNPLCRGCPYEQDCKANAVHHGELGSIPNVSLDDVQTLRGLLRISSDSMHAHISAREETDIEDLHRLIVQPMKLDTLALSFPSTLKKSRRILALPRKSRQIDSPVVEAARSKRPQVKLQRNLAFPRHEDIAVIMSLILDPSSSGGIEQYSISVISAKPFPIPNSTLHGPVSDLVPTLALLIQSIIDFQSTFSPNLVTQFYVWSPSEQSALQAHLINVALTSTAHDNEVRICIGALAQGASLLHTTYQPVLLSGALLSFLTNSRRTKAEHRACLERLGLSTEGSAAELRERVDGEIRKLQEEGGRVATGIDNRAELGQMQRVVVLKREVERLVALPLPGYWDLPECAAALLPDASPVAQCPSEEEIFSKYQNNATAALEEALARRNATIYAIIRDVRERVLKSGHSLLVNDAKALSSNFMDICRQEHIRKLFFVQQFEVLTKLNELWRSRIEGCSDAPVLQYLNPRLGANGLEHVFYLLSGTLDMPGTDKTHSTYDKIIALDEPDDPGNDIPVEALFDDLAVSGLFFPLNKYTRAKWTSQHPTVQKELLIANLRGMAIDGNRTKVFIQAWGGMGVKFIKGRNYRLSPRLVDFNTSKALAVLLEIDLRCALDPSQDREYGTEAHAGLPLLQMIIDPRTFGRNAMAKKYLKTENVIQKLFRDLKDLGSEAAGSLILKSSQHLAAQRILSNRLSVIWGPPGTGKTYTIALSLLRLLDVQYRHAERGRKIIFITAMTHAAIDACRKKLIHLMGCYRAIDSLPTEWLNRVSVEQVLKGNEHPAPSSSDSSAYVYAGTTYQLYNFTKRHSFQVDCVIIDEAGQLGLSSVALVIRALRTTGRIIIAGDSEQLAPIMSAQYPQTKMRPLFGSVLDCLMNAPQTPPMSQPDNSDNSQCSMTSEAPSSNVVQLTENFRLNPDLGEFVSTIYSRAFKPQKVQARQLARHLKLIENDKGRDLGIQAEVLADVQVFLLSLSKVMLREPQNVLLPPGLHFPEGKPDILNADTTLPPQAISLALLRLNARGMNSMVEDVGYEVHVRGEASVAAALVASIQRCSPEDDIFVATPHRVQREAVKTALARLLPSDLGLGNLRISDGSDTDSDTASIKVSGKVTVDTIERLQGSEAAFVICLFSVPKSSSSPNLGFLLERRRLNVAISRAKTLCIVVASPEVLRPGVHVLANEETAKGYAFLRAFEERAWSCELNVNLDNF